MPSSDRHCVQSAAIAQNVDLQRLGIDELARLATVGNDEAFAVLTQRMRPRLLVVLTKRLHGRVADAEDVTQETLAKAWHSIKSYDSRFSFASWLYTIAFRRATDHLRGSQRRLRHTQQLKSKEPASASAQQALIDFETRVSIWSTAKRELSDAQYIALWLRYAEELSVREIANSMGKTQVATRVLLHRARAKLHVHFAPHVATESDHET